ncbi:MAG: (2Fe-2S)-binding protein [Phycisphaerae bacterium]|nr:(2Fe-2S)-binding protein [Phycisphaerae bacterium]
MEPDDHVCLCFRVSLRKLRHYMDREAPKVPSQVADCLGAGTGCQWCVPFLKELHSQWARGETPDLPVSPEDYAARRKVYRQQTPIPLPQVPQSERGEGAGAE